MKNKYLSLSILAGLALIVLGEMLSLGYVLTQDLIFSTMITWPIMQFGSFANVLPLKLLESVLGLALPIWVVEKILLVAVFLAIPYLAYKFLPLPKEAEKARLWAAMFYLVNPFVYERFLAGHWLILASYACLPMVLGVTVTALGAGDCCVASAPRNDGKGDYASRWLGMAKVGLALALTFMFSLHLGVMALIMIAIWSVWCGRWRSVSWLKSVGMSVLVFVIATAYWTVPYLLHRTQSVIELFDSRHLEAFKTVGAVHLGTAGNVLALYGFWGEPLPWGRQFIWVKDYPVLFAVSGGLLGLLILFGITSSLRTIVKQSRDRHVALAPRDDEKEIVAPIYDKPTMTNVRFTLFMLTLGVLAFVFSCGAGDTPFRGLNVWLFDHVGFWRGFRDTQKWSALLVLVYVYFGGLGVEGVTSSLRLLAMTDKAKKLLSWTVYAISVLAVLVYSFPMLFGFWGQVKPVWYPGSWEQANEVLRQDKDCKAIFLPWHLYYTATFANNLIIANPSRAYFNCQIIQSEQVELGNIGTDKPANPAYDAIEGLVTGRDPYNTAEIREIFKKQGIKYVIYTPDTANDGSYSYDFLKNDLFTIKLSTGDGLEIYAINDTITP